MNRYGSPRTPRWDVTACRVFARTAQFATLDIDGMPIQSAQLADALTRARTA